MTAKLDDLPRVPPRKRLTGKERASFRKSVTAVCKSDPDVSIRDIRDVTGRSFGFIRTMLFESGVQMRSRGTSALCDEALEI